MFVMSLTSDPAPCLLRPLPSSELLHKIREVSGDDHSAVALTQEMLIYLAMFIRSEPELFQVHLRAVTTGEKVRVITREARYYAKTRAFASFYAIISRAHAARAVT